MRAIKSDLLRAYGCGGKKYADVTFSLRDLKSLEALASLAGAEKLAEKIGAAVKEAENELDLQTL